jgi:uncharacterized protein
MQYVVMAYDATDAEALPRRMQARPAHLEMAKTLKAQQQLIIAGAMLNDEGNMIGSVMIVDFATEEALEQWLEVEPYIVGEVWDNIDIKPYKIADI